MATATTTTSDAKADVVYAVYCHDGDEDIGQQGSDNHHKFASDRNNVDAHYYAIYALPMPEPVPVPAYLPGKEELMLKLSSKQPPSEKKPKLSLSPHQPPETKKGQPMLLATLSLSEYPSSMGFAAIGSCIYMIGGQWKSEEPSYEVFIIDTSRPLDLRNVPTGPPLLFPKIGPFVVTVLGKIFAIPTSFFSEEEWECVEFLDVASGSNEWEQIPSPKLVSDFQCEYQDPYKDEKERLSGTVGSCNVMGSLIVVTLVWGSVFELDAANPLEGWKEAATRFDVNRTAGFNGTSELIDGLLCFHEHPYNYVEKGFCFFSCLLPDLDNARQFPEYIFTHHPNGWKAGGGIHRPMGRRVLRIGDGRAAVLTHGFTGDPPNSLVLHLVLDIVCLDIVKLDPNRDKKKPGESDTALFLHQLDTVDYEIGKVNTKYGCLCCCFRMLGSSKTFATTPCVTHYSDTAAYSRTIKYTSFQ